VIGALTLFVLLDSIMLAGWALARSARRLGLGTSCAGGLVLLELVLMLRAALELVPLLRAPGGFGRGYAEPAVHLGYLVASIVVLPLVLGVSRPAEDRAAERGWHGVVAAVGCLAIMALTVRMGATGRHR
jgi:hypothetical protein